MLLRTDTIVAVATPPGQGAIAVVRLSGPDAHTIARLVCTRWPRGERVSVRTDVRAPQAALPIDTALITRFDAPRSYTGEPMVELSCHGSMVVVRDLVAALITLGARQAEPGEFTQRAVLHGKMDLLQAEAVAELIESRSSAQRDVAVSQLHGGLSALILELRAALLGLEALIAYDVDFPEEDDGPVSVTRIVGASSEVLARVRALAATAPLAEVARDGAVVVIAGPPNAGKSSLFNALIGKERAIVTEVPGTTRDALEAMVERRPWPLRLVDTAGLRQSSDPVERLGIEVSERHIRGAHVVLACGCSDVEVEATHQEIRARTEAPVLRVRTKSDLDHASEREGVFRVSAIRREGFDALLAAIDEVLRQTLGALPQDGAVITRARQRHALGVAERELESFLTTWTEGQVPPTVAAVHVRAAVQALDELIGAVDIEDIFDVVFRTFCVGK
jgi:tRNA modification GTPase